MTDRNRAGDNARNDTDASRNKKPRDNDRTPLRADGGRDIPHFEVADSEISTGDPVVDLASGKSLIVVGKSSKTVGEHPKTRSDNSAEMFGADPEEPVFSCVFLPDGEKVRPPTKTYAYPESRLLRYPIENATDYSGGVQMWLRVAFLEELADGVRRSGNDALRRDLRSLIRNVYSEDIAETFEELIDSKVTTDGGAELLSDSLKSALEESDCHADMVRYAEFAADRGGTPILNSLRHFHRETDVSRIAEIGTHIEKTLWKNGARATLDRHGHVDETNTEILREIVREKGEQMMTDGGREVRDGESRDRTGGIRPVPPHVGQPIPNGGSKQRFLELVDFRRDILLTLARSEPTHGQGLREDLSALRNEDVNDGRLYPHINALVEKGLIEKRENIHDDRSHEYVLSDAGRHSVRDHAQRVTGAVDALDGGAR